VVGGGFDGSGVGVARRGRECCGEFLGGEEGGFMFCFIEFR
jgi:hypothetical protein